MKFRKFPLLMLLTIVLSSLLIIVNSVSLPENNNGILKAKLVLCSRYTISRGEVVPLDIREDFIISERDFIAIIVFYNISEKIAINVKCFAPANKKIFEISFTVNPLVNFSVNRVPKFYIVMTVPLSEGEYIDVFCKAFAFMPIIKSQPFRLDTIYKIGLWRIDISANGKLLISRNFTVRKPLVKIITTDINNNILNNTLITILGLSSGFQKTFKGPIATLEVMPASYIAIVKYMGIIVANKTIDVTTDTIIRIPCQVFDVKIKVLDDEGGCPVSNAVVSITILNRVISNTTSSNGITVLSKIPLGKHIIKIYLNKSVIYSDIIEVSKWSYEFKLLTKTAVVQLSIKGTSGQPLRGAKIYCLNLSKVFLSDENGTVVFGPVPYGRYIFKIVYKDIKRLIAINVPPKYHKIVLDVFVEVNGITFSKEMFYALLLGSLSVIAMVISVVFVKRTFFKQQK